MAIPTISLKTNNFNPVTFNGLEYQSAVADPTVLTNSLQQQEARELDARKKFIALGDTYLKFRDSLNVAEHEAFDEQMSAAEDRARAEIAAGNTQSAVRFMMQTADDLAFNTELQDKIKVNQIYQQERQKVLNNSQLDDLTKRRWDAVNSYKFNGSADWKADWEPVRDFNLADLQNMAANMTAPDSGGYQSSTSGQTLYDNEGKPIDLSKLTPEERVAKLNNAMGVWSSGSTSGGKQWSSKSAKDMEQTLSDLLHDPKIYLGVKQKFETYLWAYKDAFSKMNDYSLSEDERLKAAADVQEYKKYLVNKDGIVIEPPTDQYGNVLESGAVDTYIREHITPMFKNMEYENIHRNDSNSISYDTDLFRKNIQRLGAQDVNEQEGAEEVGGNSYNVKSDYTLDESTYSSGSFNGFFE